MQKIHNNGRTDLYEWLENICNDFCEEQAIEDKTSLEEVKRKFYIDLHKWFLCSIQPLLYKFLTENGDDHIVEQKRLLGIPTLTNWQQKQKHWEQFVNEW